MKIQAVNSTVSPIACQPIKPVGFARRKEKPENNNAVLQNDIFIKAGDIPDIDHVMPVSDDIKHKYETACLIAGFYKTQYENLLKEGKCSA